MTSFACQAAWRQGETYIFVLDPQGYMLVHPDPAMEGKNEIELKDINGKPIIRGLIGAATRLPKKPEGWYHYQWPVPEGITELVNAAFPSLEGKNLIGLKGLSGKVVVQEEIDAAMKEGTAWVDIYWDKPGQNIPARKQTFVRRVQSGPDTYIVGAGVYME